MEFQITEHGSELYYCAMELRRRILRLPLGLDFSEEDIADEASETSVVASESGSILGAMQLRPLSDSLMKVRQVAVDEQAQGKGIGRGMGEFAEGWIKGQGYGEIVLHARATVVPFYLKQGYEIVGDEFIEVTIPHFEMRKSL